MDIADDVLCLYTARLTRQDGSYVFDVPENELANGDLERGGVYRIAVLPTRGEGRSSSGSRRPRQRREPPVEEGDVREVEIEGLGDQGDGIARVDRGYVVIVPDTEVGDEVEIEIEELHDNFAMGRVVDGEERASDAI